MEELMGAHPFVVIDDTLLKMLPEPFRQDPDYQLGKTLELVPATALAMKSYDRPIRSWRDLEGILADSEADPNATLTAEKARELKLESR